MTKNPQTRLSTWGIPIEYSHQREDGEVREYVLLESSQGVPREVYETVRLNSGGQFLSTAQERFTTGMPKWNGSSRSTLCPWCFAC